MVKRQFGVDPANIIDSDTRVKRRKEDSEASDRQQKGEGSVAEPDTSLEALPGNIDEDDATDPHAVQEKGMQLLNVLKDARNKDNHDLSYDFMRLPSKRQYPDYYVFIKRPICLDDIKSKLDSFEYTNLDEVKQDLDTCFKNARKYNQKESGIWKAAKVLQKLAKAEYEKITNGGESPDEDIDVMNGADEGSGDDETHEQKRKKPQPLHKILKNRLNKLVEKTDETGRLLSFDFMDPPDKKAYPEYYRLISNVMCFKWIFKKIRRKEYTAAAEFADEVELVFKNAFEFNVEESSICQDARILKDYFAKLMATLPPEHAISAYASNQVHTGKIKFRLPATASSAQNDVQHPGDEHLTRAPTRSDLSGAAVGSTTNLVKPDPVSQTITSVLRETGVSDSLSNPDMMRSQSYSPALNGKAALTVRPSPAAAHVVARSMPASAEIGQHSTANGIHQPQAAALQEQPYSASSPAPIDLPQKFPIQSVLLLTAPKGRSFPLRREEGVRIWSLRLGASERAIRLREVEFVEAEGADIDDNQDSEDGRQGRLRKRPGQKERTQPKERDKKETESKVETPSPVIRLNGNILKSNTVHATSTTVRQSGDEWAAELPAGMSLLEVMGDLAGETWKIYLERLQY